jgi:hypothetical protein
MRKLLILALGLLLGLASLPATAAENYLNSVLQAGKTASVSLNAAADAAYMGSDPTSSAESALAGAGATAGSYSQYYFVYYYYSGDYYYGYVYAPTGLLRVGSYIYNEPAPMGGASLSKGFYCITGVSNGYSSAYDAEEYITSYYDADSGKSSDTLYGWSGAETAGHSLYVYDRRQTAESGYVYDPSVPSTDAYFGTPDVVYHFDINDNTEANFLVTYIPDLPYWNQPDSYPNSCAEVAAAIVLSYWDKHGYPNLISSHFTDWQTQWLDDTANTSSYVSLIGDLCSLMDYNMLWGLISGTSVNGLATGLYYYACCTGYGDLASSISIWNVDDFDRSTSWSGLTSTLKAGDPSIAEINYNGGDGDHYVTVRGYWNDGHIVANLGWGSAYNDWSTACNNVKLDWYNTDETYSYKYAEIVNLVIWPVY